MIADLALAAQTSTFAEAERKLQGALKELDTYYQSLYRKGAMSQQYSLRWNNHQPNFISMFTSLLSTQTLVDVTLAAEGRQLMAHKVVLSACSTYFQSLFVDNPSRHPIVILKDVTFADLRTMVDFIYYGEVNVTQEQLPKVLDTAKLLKIKGLTDMPDSTSLTRAPGAEAGPSATSHHTLSSSLASEDASVSELRNTPPHSPSQRKKRRRKSSAGSSCLVADETGTEETPSVEVCRDAITLSSVSHSRRDYTLGDTQQTNEGLNVEPLAVEAGTGMAPGWTMMEHHGYGRYSNACLGGLQPESGAGLYMGGAVHEALEYAPVVGPSPGPSCAPPPPAPDAPPAPAPRRRRTTNPQSEENFQRALEAVRFGGIGFCKAARMFGVNNRTLWLEYKKRGYPNNRPSIKSRIKRENNTPPPEPKDDMPQMAEQQMLLCPPVSCPPVPVSFIESRPVDFQAISHSSPLSLLGVNFTTAMQ